ncbi:MAG TPA: hypothetical protein VEL75_00445 [Candidatus Methylomirabilis sp.]|nr:hypothetical protein [Candidatus Methylomirabilis sp.]
MTRFLHLLKGDSAPLAGAVISANGREPGAEITVVLLDATAPPALASSIRLRRLDGTDLDYSGLLDLIFESDHVVSW